MGVSDRGQETAATADGVLERLGGRCVLRFRRHLSHSPEKVWRAMTEDAHLAGWFPTTVEGERAAGAPLRFSFPKGEADPFSGEMLVFDPPSVLEIRWGDDLLRFVLTPAEDASCLLDLTVTFPEHGKAARDAAGWHVCLEQLAVVADDADAPLPWDPADRWRVVHPGYVERFGAEASAIGPPPEWERLHGAEADAGGGG